MEDFDEAVYDVVERIPPGKVMSYGDIAEYLGRFGARRVALAMSRSGGAAMSRSGGAAMSRSGGAAMSRSGGAAMSHSGGAAMSHSGGRVPWHRVLRTDGTPAPRLADEQLRRLRAEGAPLNGRRVDMRAARWDGRTVRGS